MTPQELTMRMRSLGPGALPRLMLRAIATQAALAEGEAKANATTSPRVRTGRLRASIRGAAALRPDGVELTLRAGGPAGGRLADPVVYARVQEEGGKVRPRRARMLRIPLPAARTAAGVDRYPTPLRETMPGAFRVGRSRRGNLLLFGTGVGGTRRGIPYYVLRDETVVPAHWYMRRAWGRLLARLPAAIHAVLRGA